MGIISTFLYLRGKVVCSSTFLGLRRHMNDSAPRFVLFISLVRINHGIKYPIEPRLHLLNSSLRGHHWSPGRLGHPSQTQSPSGCTNTAHLLTGGLRSTTGTIDKLKNLRPCNKSSKFGGSKMYGTTLPDRAAHCRSCLVEVL